MMVSGPRSIPSMVQGRLIGDILTGDTRVNEVKIRTEQDIGPFVPAKTAAPAQVITTEGLGSSSIRNHFSSGGSSGKGFRVDGLAEHLKVCRWVFCLEMHLTRLDTTASGDWSTAGFAGGECSRGPRGRRCEGRQQHEASGRTLPRLESLPDPL